VLQVEAERDELAVPLQVGAALFEGGGTLLELGADVLVARAGLAVPEGTGGRVQEGGDEGEGKRGRVREKRGWAFKMRERGTEGGRWVI
jgi:hypothetical protein